VRHPRRGDKRKGKFDALIVETTGLAVRRRWAQTFFVDEDVAERKNRPADAVVTVAECEMGCDRRRTAPEAKN